MPGSQDDGTGSFQKYFAAELERQRQRDLDNVRFNTRNTLYEQLTQSNAISRRLTQDDVLRAMQRMRQPANLEQQMEPKFKVGDEVLIRGNKTVWHVLDVRRVADDNYTEEFAYKLNGTERYAGRETIEKERHLTAVDKIPEKPRPKVTFESVIISDDKRQQILEALEQVNQQDLIFETWGFGETVEKGKGVSMLFYGPPGTGKTLMGQAIADKLDMTLKVISTADIESSSPGESERNIRKHFKDAKKDGKTILLFDECDSLIFSRAGVGAILGAQINELLSQIEKYDGITIFTTNRLGMLDEAVNRRLALKLEFGMPTRDERAKIWQRMFPKKAPIAKDVDFTRLAIVEMTGGYIKNAVLRAARMAAIEKIADSKKKITMAHLMTAVEQEATAMEEFEAARAEHGSHGGRVTGPDGMSLTTGRKMVHKAALGAQNA